ncbi:MAG: hypothetical protein JWQ74_3499 [Marmoricola sp.]|nr:hypothetical protein [Marmoricola sp.]
MALKVLRISGSVELITLLVMLSNLATVRIPGVDGLIGSLHGLAYLTVVATVLLVEGAGTKARLLSIIPGIGGLMAVRNLMSTNP